jgi:hypothetical protein
MDFVIDEVFLDQLAQKGVVPFDTRNGVYKYRTIERAKQVLESNTIYFANALEMKDQYELHPSFFNLEVSPETKRKYLTRLLATVNEPYFDLDENAFKRLLNIHVSKFRESVGIFSAARNATNGLLWERYGDDDRGVCFCFKNSLFINKLTLAVNYTNTPLKIDLIHPEFATISPDFLYPICTKRRDYLSENEVRIIDELRCGPAVFEKSFLNEVIFGLKTSIADQKDILRLVEEHQYRVQKVGKIVMGDFGYNIEYF